MQRDGARYLSWAVPAAPHQLPSCSPGCWPSLSRCGQWSPAPLPLFAALFLEAPRSLGKLGASFTWADSPPRDPSWLQAGPGPIGQIERGEGGAGGHWQAVGRIWVEGPLGLGLSVVACLQLLLDHLPVLPASSPGPCSPNPCHNDAECQEIDHGLRGDVFTEYICRCPVGFMGTHCESSEYPGVPAPRGTPCTTGLVAQATCWPSLCIRVSSGWIWSRAELSYFGLGRQGATLSLPRLLPAWFSLLGLLARPDVPAGE